MASMHLVLRQQDGQEKDSGEYRHITNTTFEKFIERFLNLASTRNHDISEVHTAVTTSLEQIQHENEVATKLRKQLEHEMVVLDERKAVSVLLVLVVTFLFIFGVNALHSIHHQNINRNWFNVDKEIEKNLKEWILQVMLALNNGY